MEVPPTETCAKLMYFCGRSPVQGRIVGGTLAQRSEFPWIVYITMAQALTTFSGTLITHRHVLTAAHCVLEGIFDVNSIELHVGLHLLSEAYAPYHAVDIVVHEGFITNKEVSPDDIAIITVDKPINFNQKVQPACVPRNEESRYEEGSCVVAGWGFTSEGGRLAKELHKIVLPLLPIRICNEYYPDTGEGIICAGSEEGRDACQGDSGGPLHIINEYGFYEVVGIVSLGEGCGRLDVPGIYTKVSYYLDWIRDKIGNDCLCSYSPNTWQISDSTKHS